MINIFVSLIFHAITYKKYKKLSWISVFIFLFPSVVMITLYGFEYLMLK